MHEHLTTSIIVGMAAAFLIRAWLHGSIFASAKSWIEDEQLVKLLPEKLSPLSISLTTLLLCPLCLSPWVSLVMLLTLFLQNDVNQAFSSLLVVKTFAAATVAKILYSTMKTE